MYILDTLIVAYLAGFFPRLFLEKPLNRLGILGLNHPPLTL